VKNITVSIDDETYRRARVKAAEQDMSVSALVREFLQSLSAGARPAKGAAGLSEGTRDYIRDGKTAPSRRARRATTDALAQLQLMEELWTRLSGNEAGFKSPEWHKDALAETEGRYKAGEEKPIDWAAAKRTFRKRA
jgi:hypothetical protein